MDSLHSKSSTSNNSSGRAHYQVKRTVTDSNGKTHTETIEMYDHDAIQFMRNLRSNQSGLPDLDQFGFRPLENPSNFPELAQRHARYQQSLPTMIPSVSTSKDVKEIQDNVEFARDALATHNELRRRHGANPLQLNSDLSKLAQQWANHLASSGQFVHSKTKYQNVNVGENLRCQSWPMTGSETTESWYNECTKYDYRNPSFQPGTGHFTQVVWKGTREVGFGRAQGKSINVAVAMYYPPGNYINDFDKNVFPPH